MVAGSLLGLDQGSILEVTHCFPFPAPSDRDEYVEPSDLGNGNEDIDGEEYQEVIEHMPFKKVSFIATQKAF